MNHPDLQGLRGGFCLRMRHMNYIASLDGKTLKTQPAGWNCIRRSHTGWPICDRKTSQKSNGLVLQISGGNINADIAFTVIINLCAIAALRCDDCPFKNIDFQIIRFQCFRVIIAPLSVIIRIDRSSMAIIEMNPWFQLLTGINRHL